MIFWIFLHSHIQNNSCEYNNLMCFQTCYNNLLYGIRNVSWQGFLQKFFSIFSSELYPGISLERFQKKIFQALIQKFFSAITKEFCTGIPSETPPNMHSEFSPENTLDKVSFGNSSRSFFFQKFYKIFLHTLPQEFLRKCSQRFNEKIS